MERCINMETVYTYLQRTKAIKRIEDCVQCRSLPIKKKT